MRLLRANTFTLLPYAQIQPKRKRSPSGRRPPDESPNEEDLLTQREYADTIGVSPGYVSRRTSDGGLIDDTSVPPQDAVFDEEGNLLGYTNPTDRSNSNGEVSPEVSPENDPEAPRDTSGGEGDQARGNPSAQGNGSNQATSRDQPGGNDGLEEAIDRASKSFGQEAARRPEGFHAVLRLGGAALGAVLGAEIGRGAVPALVGTAVGAGLVEISIRSTPARPQEPTRQIEGLSLPAANVPTAGLPAAGLPAAGLPGRHIVPADLSHVFAQSRNGRDAQ